MKDQPANAPQSALDELLAAEDQIAAALAQATEEADALLAAARAEAAARTRTSEEQLSRDLATLDQRAQVAREQLLRALETEATQTASRYRSLPDSEVARLAELVAVEVTGLGAEGIP